jgi:hypothetical protein
MARRTLVGILAAVAGVALSIGGGAGGLDWIGDGESATSRLTHAAPGLLLLLIGAVILLRDRRQRQAAMENGPHGGRDTVARVPDEERAGGGGPRSRLEVDSVRRLREEIEKARKDR